MTDYPNKQDQSKRLRPYVWLLWLVALALFASGLLIELCLGVPSTFSKLSSLAILWSVGVFFFLEKREFLTGQGAEMFDSAGHVIPRGIVGPHVTWVTILGSIGGIFGDWIVALFNCGGLEC